jgi:hypothetical protein
MTAIVCRNRPSIRSTARVPRSCKDPVEEMWHVNGTERSPMRRHPANAANLGVHSALPD